MSLRTQRSNLRKRLPQNETASNIEYPISCIDLLPFQQTLQQGHEIFRRPGTAQHAALAVLQHDEAGRRADRAHAIINIRHHALDRLAAGQAGGKLTFVQPQFTRQAEQRWFGILHTPLVNGFEQQVVHLPEHALVCGALGGGRGYQRLGMHLQGQVFVHPQDLACVNQRFVDRRLGLQAVLLAGRALEIREFDHHHAGLRVALVLVAGQGDTGAVRVRQQAVRVGPEGQLGRFALGDLFLGRRLADQHGIDPPGEGLQRVSADQRVALAALFVGEAEAGRAGEAQALPERNALADLRIDLRGGHAGPESIHVQPRHLCATEVT